jgi:hypothetical protein
MHICTRVFRMRIRMSVHVSWTERYLAGLRIRQLNKADDIQTCQKFNIVVSARWLQTRVFARRNISRVCLSELLRNIS